MSWTLRIGPAAGECSLEPSLKVCGLSLPLRMVLAAQEGGASRIELANQAGVSPSILDDRRRRVPVVEGEAEPGPEGLVIEAPWNLVFHRGLLGEIAKTNSAGVVRLPDHEQAFEPPFGFSPMLLTNRASVGKAESLLLRSLRKTQDGWTSTYLNRAISLSITRWLTKLPLRPNQLSVGILAIGLLGAWLAAQGQYGWMVLGAVLFQAQSVLDGCDGELSRVTYQGSKLGEWVDTVGDDITNYSFFAGASWGLYRLNGNASLYLIAGAVMLACGVLTSAIEYRYLWRIGSGDLLKYPLGIGKAPGGGEKGALGKVADLVSPLFKRDTFVFLTLVGAVVGQLGPFLFAFAIGAVGILVAVLRAESHMARYPDAGR